MLPSVPNPRPPRACKPCELLAEYGIDVDKRLQVLFGHGEAVLHCGGRGGLWWKLLFDAQARGNNTSSAAKPTTAAVPALSIVENTDTGR